MSPKQAMWVWVTPNISNRLCQPPTGHVSITISEPNRLWLYEWLPAGWQYEWLSVPTVYVKMTMSEPQVSYVSISDPHLLVKFPGVCKLE